MTETLHPSAQTTAGSTPRFDDVAISFHWLTLALIVVQFSTAWLLGSATDAFQTQLLLAVHRSLGLLTWGLTVVRLGWRLLFTILPPFPPTMPKLQQQIAKANEYGLYLLLVLQPLTGLGQTLFRGHPFVIFFQRVPKIVAQDVSVVHGLEQLHSAGAVALLGLIGIHAAAALFHRFVLRDDVLQRMLPKRRPSVRRSAGIRESIAR